MRNGSKQRKRAEFWCLTATASLMSALVFASPATAATVVDQRPQIFSFDGSDSSIGRFAAVGAVAVDEETGDVYAINAAGNGKGPGAFDDERVICRFKAEGKAQNFTDGQSAGRSCLDGAETPSKAFGIEGFFAPGAFVSDVAVDNSGGSGGPGEGEQGRLYVSEEDGPVHAFAPDGTWLWTLPRTTARPCGIAVDAEGHLWVGNGYGEGESGLKAFEFDNTGSPPGLIGSVAITHANKRACRLAIDKSGKGMYVGLAGEAPSGLDKYREGKYDSSFSATNRRPDVTIDQSKDDGHIFDTDGTGFGEHEPCLALGCPGTEVAGSPFGGDLIGNSQGIAYNPAEDWVYVADRASNTVKVFGPVASGTAPDVSCQATEPVGLHSITANCTINPLGLPNAYHFEWKEGTGANWGAAESSPAQGIGPTDSNPHAVSLEITEYNGEQLRSNSTFQVRLAGTNTENDLSAYSNAETATTLVPPVPEVECSSSAITAQSAHVSCAVDPRKEETGWRILSKAQEHATQAECEALASSEFHLAQEGTIPPKEPGTVEVAADLTELDPAQPYCVRAIATNQGGSAQDDLSFKTLAIPPGDASTAFAAPRTDTRARINARVDPHGDADFKYRFEWSQDGTNWTALPIHESSIDAREPILVADQLSGLQPATRYYYRLGLLENEAGPATSLGAARTFMTRSEVEIQAASPSVCPNADVRSAQHSSTYLGACRGIELVSSPDKGNQNVLAFDVASSLASPISPDGNKVVWSVTGGAPGGPNGTESYFLAERTGASTSGWDSASIAPPAVEQVGKGDLTYIPIATNSDFSTFIFSARTSAGFSCCPAPTVVRVRDGQQDILSAYTGQPPNPGYENSVDLSEDGKQVLFMNSASKQLEDIGAARVGPPKTEGEVVSLMPSGLPSQCGLDLFTGKSFPGLIGSSIGHRGDPWLAKVDGSRVYFRVQADPPEPLKAGEQCKSAYGLYVRNRDAAKTTLIDPGSPEFIRTTPNGHQAYFATFSSCRKFKYPQLTCETPESADTDASADIYRWDEEAGAEGESSCLTCIATVPAQVAEAGGNLTSVLISRDLSHIYFYSPQRLVPGQGKQGALNLYLLVGEEIRFVATTATDVLQRSGPALSADGNVLLFETQASAALSADAMPAQCAKPNGGLGNCVQRYLYDDRDGSLECISCNHDGLTSRSVGAPASGTLEPTVLSGDGTTAAFATIEALLPADVNDDTDLYEWRYGTLHLITDGASDFQEGLSVPRLWAIDGSGQNILFGLVPPEGKLTGFERDGVLNLYDARIGGGFEPPVPETHCVEDSCQGPLQAAPPIEQPASSAFAGRGNSKADLPKCTKGKVRRHGRCVPRTNRNHRRQKQTRHSHPGQKAHANQRRDR